MNKKSIILVISGIVIFGVAIIGGSFYMNEKTLNDDMLEVVKSKEAQMSYVRTIKNLDSKALTPEGIIQTFKVDFKTVKRNPIGGIMLELIVNDDEKLTIDVLLEKGSEAGMLKNGWGGVSKELNDLLEPKIEEEK
ncbi:DUF1310 family protein [uncultured Vagococcus sp.]|uniref:DUF1310 family protein n=1 Tax=uncultured Vagococcus sp. TaxID=189676 RepID=UPI0028D82EEC|nr:DUF1310 family protein [uncultured Vagococcus sp.]